MAWTFSRARVLTFNKLASCRRTSVLGRLLSSSAKNAETLKRLFEPYHRPGLLEKLVEKEPRIRNVNRAAVLIPVSFGRLLTSDGPSESYFTFTKRTKTMKFYGGQVCFMGGRKDESDRDELHTALREAREEVGLEARHLTVLAQLCPLLTTNVGRDVTLVTPVVAHLDDAAFTPMLNREEVETLYKIPTREFLDRTHHDFQPFEMNGQEFNLHYFHKQIGGEEVSMFGATAFLSIVVSVVLNSRLPEFVVDPQFDLKVDNVNRFLEYYIEKSTHLVEMFLSNRN